MLCYLSTDEGSPVCAAINPLMGSVSSARALPSERDEGTPWRLSPLILKPEASRAICTRAQRPGNTSSHCKPLRATLAKPRAVAPPARLPRSPTGMQVQALTAKAPYGCSSRRRRRSAVAPAAIAAPERPAVPPPEKRIPPPEVHSSESER